MPEVADPTSDEATYIKGLHMVLSSDLFFNKALTSRFWAVVSFVLV
jgi:hypothetical protein